MSESSPTKGLKEYFAGLSALQKAFIVFCSLLLFIIVVEQPGSDSSKAEKRARYFIPTMVIESVGSVEINSPFAENRVLLTLEEGKWRVANGHPFPAESQQVSDFLETLHELKEDSVVSSNPDRFPIFGVDEATSTRVIVKDLSGKELSNFFAGHSTQFREQYVRREGENKVYLTNHTLFPHLFMNVNDWKDKTLLAVEEPDFSRFAILRDGEETVVERSDAGLWEVTAPDQYPASELALRTLFDAIANLRASGFADVSEGSQADFENPDFKLSVRLNDDTLKFVAVSAFEDEAGNTKYFAKNAEREVIYTLSQGTVETLFEQDFHVSEDQEAEEGVAEGA